MNNNIGEIIKEKRKELNMTAKELAEKAEISAAYLSKIENNERKAISYQIVDRIRTILNLNIITTDEQDNILTAKIDNLVNMLMMLNKRKDNIKTIEIQKVINITLDIIQFEK